MQLAFVKVWKEVGLHHADLEGLAFGQDDQIRLGASAKVEVPEQSILRSVAV